jgi:NTE family protein
VLIPDRNGAAPRIRRTVSPRTVLAIACLGVFMAFVDNTIVSIAFPNMLESFPAASLGDLSWVFNVYNIALAVLLVPAGRFADLLGRRRMFGWGVVLFTVASALCALAPSVGLLIAGRALQGAGAAIILPASLGLILEAFPGERRAGAIAIWTATGALAAGIGPSIGGGLVNLSDWRLVFLINLPVGVVVWRLAHTHLVESRAPGRRSVPDLGGALLLGLGIGTLTLGIVQAESWGWLGWPTLLSLLTAVAATVLLVGRTRRHASPIIDPQLLRSRSFSVSGVLTAVGSAGFFAVGLANILYLIQIWGYSPLTAGLAGTPAPFLAAFAAVAAGRFIGTRDPRPWIAIGALIWAAGPLILLAQFSTEPHYLTGYLPGAAVLAIGIGITFPLVSGIAVGNAPGGRYAGATALNSSIRQIGAALGVAILVALVGQPSGADIEPAFERAWLFSTICFALVAAGALALGRPRTVAAEENLEATVAVPSPAVPDPAPMQRRQPRAERAKPAAGPRSIPEFLADVPLFAGLGETEREDLAARTTTVSAPAGSWLFRQGDDADALYIVRSGRLEVVDETPGAEARVLREMARGSVLGELALIGDSARTASVRVRRDAHLLRIARADFESVMAESASVSQSLLQTLAQWLTSGRAFGTTQETPTTIAVVSLDPAAAAAQIDHALAEALDRLGAAHLVPEGGEAGARDGHALSELLDRLELDFRHVVLAAGTLAGGGSWTDACLRQADRVLLVVADPAAPRGAALPRGCDLMLLCPPTAPGTAALLDEVQPRALHRVQSGERSGEDIAAAARRIAGRAVGLVLSGGGARCFTQIGVIEELRAAGIRIDRIAGTSMGAFIGALLAQGMDVTEIDARCYEEWVRHNPLGDYRLPRVSLIRGERARAMLERNLPGQIEDLARPYFCVSVDIVSGQVVQHRRGLLSRSVGASMALPILAPPVIQQGRILLDGGLMDNLPTEAMAADREGPIIAVDCSDPAARAVDPSVEPPVPMLMETIFRVMQLSESDSERRSSFADVLIRPDYDGVGILEFHMLDRMRDSGRRAALEALSKAPATVFGG